MLVIQRFEEEIKKEPTISLYFCFSADYFLLAEAKKLVNKQFSRFAMEIFESPEEINNQTLIKSASLFSEKRILLVYNFEKIKKIQQRIEWLENLVSADSKQVIIFVLCNASSDDLSDEIKYLKKYKNVAIFNLDIHERELPDLIQYKAKKEGIFFSKDAVNYIIDITGGHPGIISSEIEKISVLLNKSTIEVSDIKEILSEISEYNAFDLVDAIKKKDIDKIFNILNNIQNTDLDMFIGALNWYYSSRKLESKKIFSLLYNTNLAIRQSRSCSLELLVYELLRD